MAEGDAAVRPAEVVLVSMPFGPLRWPSLGLSLFQAALEPLGVSHQALYFGIPFAREIGPGFYDFVSRGRPAIPDLVGEWIFSGALFGDDAPDTEEYVRDVLLDGLPAHRHRARNPPEFVEAVLDARARAPRFVDECCENVLARAPRLVCFTSVFHQNAASLALAAALKRTSPETYILFGGANCEGPMGLELIRSFEAVDAIVSGEADLLFPRLVERILGGRSLEGIPGVVTRRGLSEDAPPAQDALKVPDLDLLPEPDYDDFFEQWQALAAEHPEIEARLLFETSRGCWWGEKAHCTFCGLNGGSMAFRSKSPERAIDEFNRLVARYPNRSIFVVDNILDMKYFKDFFPMLAEQENEVELFYEVKANLTKKQVRQLFAAGIREIQPGIESLSSPILEQMRKGVTSLQNVQLLKWCKEIGIRPIWNMLYGFPGEAPEEYDRMTELVPWLTHLPAPLGPLAVRLDRFSPYFEQASDFGLTEVEPYPSYFHVYPLEAASVARLAYYFTAEVASASPLEEYSREFVAAIGEWQALGGRGDLYSVPRAGELLVFDTRPVAVHAVTELVGVERALVELCDRIRSIDHLGELIEGRIGRAPSVRELDEGLERLVECGLMLREGNKALSLPIPVGSYVPSELAIADSLRAMRDGAAALGTADRARVPAV